jgi:hypothetical protein
MLFTCFTYGRNINNQLGKEMSNSSWIQGEFGSKECFCIFILGREWRRMRIK